MKTTKFNGLIVLTLFAWAGQAQAQLSLNAALDSALQQRLGLVIARNGAEMARLQNTPGMAGMLPFVSLGSGLGLSGTSIDQQFSNGTVIRRDGVQVNNASSNLGVSWTLFDGMRMFVMRDRLQALENLGEQRVFAETVRISTSTRLAFHGAAREQAVLDIEHHLPLDEQVVVEHQRVLREIHRAFNGIFNWYEAKIDFARLHCIKHIGNRAKRNCRCLG